MTELPTELMLLGWSVVLLVTAIVLQGQLAKRELGIRYNAGSRDEGLQPTGVLAGRAQRALDNLKESYPAFVALALALVVADRDGGLGAIGAWLWFVSRIVFHILYLTGVPFVRSLAWIASMLGLLLMLIRLL